MGYAFSYAFCVYLEWWKMHKWTVTDQIAGLEKRPWPCVRAQRVFGQSCHSSGCAVLSYSSLACSAATMSVTSAIDCFPHDRSSSVWPDRQAAEILLQHRVLRLAAPGEHCHVSIVGYEEETEWFADAADSGNTERWADHTVTSLIAYHLRAAFPIRTWRTQDSCFMLCLWLTLWLRVSWVCEFFILNLMCSQKILLTSTAAAVSSVNSTKINRGLYDTMLWWMTQDVCRNRINHFRVILWNDTHDIHIHEETSTAALKLLVGWREGHPVYKKLGVGLLAATVCLDRCTFYSSSFHHQLHHN